jgi:predicted Zn-dependent protease
MNESDTSKITSRLGHGAVVHGTVEDRDEPTEPAGRVRGQWDPAARERDARYGEALERSRAGDKQGALACFDRFCSDFPGHVHARLQLFQLALELRDQARAAEHHDWIVSHYLQGTNIEGLCQTYRDTRLAFPQLRWSEKALIQIMHAGEKTHDARVAVDAAKLLIHTHPNSPTVPRALLLGARVQEQEGRPDLARATLQSIVGTYPMDPVAEVAKRRLAQLA